MIKVDRKLIELAEGTRTKVHVRLDRALDAGEKYQLGFTTGNSDVVVSPSVMTFTSDNINDPQPLSIAAIHDCDEVGHGVAVLIRDEEWVILEELRVIITHGDAAGIINGCHPARED